VCIKCRRFAALKTYGNWELWYTDRELEFSYVFSYIFELNFIQSKKMEKHSQFTNWTAVKIVPCLQLDSFPNDSRKSSRREKTRQYNTDDCQTKWILLHRFSAVHLLNKSCRQFHKRQLTGSCQTEQQLHMLHTSTVTRETENDN